MITDIRFDSEFFDVKKVSKGVYALIDKNNSGSNAGIIDLGTHVIIFDTFLDINIAKDMKRLCSKLTEKEPTFVINSHSHYDHIIGNCLFKDAKILSSLGTQETIKAAKQQILDEKDDIVKQVGEIKEKLTKTDNEEEIKNLENNLNFYSNIINPEVSIRVPDITFDSEMIINGNKELKLIKYDIAHSNGDVIGYLPKDKVCFLGDLLFNENHPWLGNGNPINTINILEDLLNYDIEYFIPGHGKIASKADVKLQIKYIKEIMELVKSKKEIKDANFEISELSSEFHEWRDLCFKWNINFLLNQYKK